ncbi:MAG: GlsB/YeaQ/YmgE family stress response membrane protein [Acidobacteria bacterium]|nr:GlsB/YeaQ/YmgE family stress response membrane protein [Acidobacteriota bacterium]
MGVLVWTLLGALIGALAGLIMPERPVGCATTVSVCIVGAVFVGFLGRFIGLYESVNSMLGWLLPILGAVGILAVYRVTRGKFRS